MQKMAKFSSNIRFLLLKEMKRGEYSFVTNTHKKILFLVAFGETCLFAN